MKKLALLVLLFIGATQVSQSQIKFGIKGGINYNSDSFQDVKDDVLDGAKSKTGFHAGIWLEGDIPVAGLFIRPELVYTQLKNGAMYYPQGKSAGGTEVSYSFRKIDLPVLVGTKVLKIGRIFAGPSFQYILDSEFSLGDLKDVNTDGFSLGLQFGAGVEIGKLGLDIRWERALSDTETKFVNNNIIGGGDVNFDTRVNQIIIGLSYKF